ncbi:hypothetical protein VUR80DRAFT_2140 [Thermomyces stellatus]
MLHEPRWRSRKAPGLQAAIRCAFTLLLAGPASAAARAPGRFPYIPTTILAPPVITGEQADSADDNTAYVFSERDGSVEFSYLDIGGSVDGHNGFNKLSSDLPFLKGRSNTTVFSPVLAENGDVLVYVGDCESPSNYGVWTYTPSDDGESEWEEHTTSLSSDDTPTYAGPNSLGASLAFSSQLQPSVSDPVIYSFGGMCANTTDATSWQSAGRYSKDMRKASLSDSDFTLSAVPSRGPVAEAGFTLTGLQPSLSQHGDTVTQRRSYVMLGGHTREAFINMSTAAVWNLPEETWSFVDVKASKGASEVKGDLAVRSEEHAVDSRSGHTAVLSEDGTSIVLLGGWVGNVSCAAQPQLLVLKMGASYDEWEWVVPDEQPNGSGIYGHGAALLPGNVMMVYGGYDIEEPSWRLSRRQSFSDGPQFLDLSSMKWSSSYTNPSLSGSDSSGSGASKGEDEGDGGRARRIGLGVGLGVGVPILIAAAGLFLLCRRYTNRRRTMRDDAIAALAQDRTLFLHSELDMAETDFDGYDPFGPGQPRWYTGGGGPYDRGARSLGAETLRGGRHGLGLASATQVPRKPVPRVPRGMYQPAVSAAPSGIHPIAEADEELEQGHDNGEHAHPATEVSNPPTPTSQPHSDPFANPLPGPALHPASRSSATPSPEARQDPDVQDWMTDVDAVEGLLARREQRRSASRGTSPAKTASRAFTWDDDTRTGSNLSETARSAISTITRSTSGRSHIRNGFGLAPGGGAADGRPGSSSSASPSYDTAKSSFTVMQAEGPGLLHGTGGAEVEHYDPPTHQDEQEEEDIPGSPSKMKPRRGWLGSLRRVFAPAAGAAEELDESPTRGSFEHTSADFEPRPHRLSSIGGGSLLRRKQGKHAWEDAPPASGSKRNSAVEVEAERRDSGETDWDIERAVEQRLVQVMFTVPREPLRVVNAEVEGDETSMGGRRSPARSLTGEGRTSPARSVVEDGVDVRRLEEFTLPEVRPLSALGDSFIERVASKSSLYREFEDVEMDKDATVAPLSLPDRASTTPEASRGSLATDEDTAVQVSLISTPPRRRTKVLEMVESIESKSRAGSPQRK